MPTTFPVLELRQDGDVTVSRVKSANAKKPVLKDIQSHLKKKTLPAVLATYPYGSKRITIIGYVEGKEADLSQHQLPPPCDSAEIYGTIILISHSIKTAWDACVTGIEEFTTADYEVFFEKACSGELEEDADENADEEDLVKEDEEEAEQDEEDVDVDEEGEHCDDEDEIMEDDEEAVEEAPRVRVSRKVAKIDPQQLQFQFKSVLEKQEEVSMDTVNAVAQRQHTVEILSELLCEHCSEDDLLELENGIYNASLDEAKRRLIPLTWEHATFKWIYNMITKRTVSNFQPDSYVGNASLIQRWKEGEFSLREIGHWSPYDLKPSHWKDLKDQQFRRDKRILEGNLAMATDRFRCSRCTKKLCSYYELQTRSADEPMTIFISCLNCGKQWKQ
jgi:hypothetical protein